MAIVTFIPGILSIHGRIGNIIFQTYGPLNIVRSYTPPRYTRTPAQAKNRDDFKALVHLWQSLSPKDVKRWNAVGAGFSRKGYAWFLHVNLTRVKQGFHPLTRPLRVYPGLGMKSPDRFTKTARVGGGTVHPIPPDRSRPRVDKGRLRPTLVGVLRSLDTGPPSARRPAPKAVLHGSFPLFCFPNLAL